MMNYLIELSIIHMLLTGAYWLFLKNETDYRKLRIYIIGASIISLAIPVFRLPKLFQSASVTEFVAGPAEAILIEEMTFAPATNSSLDISVVVGLYLLVSGFFLFQFFRNLFGIIKLERESNYEKFFNIRIRRTSKIKGSFTFFRWIFLSEDVQPDQKEYDVILRHEKAHASLGHSYDLMFLELFKVAFWWLPTAWLAKKEIKKIHEYQADAYALKAFSIDRYSSILISSTLKANGLSLASSFHDGLIIKRLKAMKQKAKNVSPWKIGTVTLLIATLFVAFACSEEIEQNIKEMGDASNAISFDQLPANMQADLASIKDKLTFIKIDGEDLAESKSRLAEMESIKDLDPNTIHSMSVFEDVGGGKSIIIALKKEGANFDYLAETSKSDGNVFTVVERQPQFPGGNEALIEYLVSELKYPKEAAEEGIEGRVMVQFVVAKDGSISQVEALKGIGSGCDEEAVRVISSMPDFIPGSQRGKKVAVRMVMPIVFSLTQDEVSTSKVTLSEIKSNFSLMKIDAQYDNGVWTGTIVNAKTGKEMPGVNVVQDGSSVGTVTDLDGSFKLKVKDTSADLILTHVGYKSERLSN